MWGIELLCPHKIKRATTAIAIQSFKECCIFFSLRGTPKTTDAVYVVLPHTLTDLQLLRKYRNAVVQVFL